MLWRSFSFQVTAFLLLVKKISIQISLAIHVFDVPHLKKLAVSILSAQIFQCSDFSIFTFLLPMAAIKAFLFKSFCKKTVLFLPFLVLFFLGKRFSGLTVLSSLIHPLILNFSLFGAYPSYNFTTIFEYDSSNTIVDVRSAIANLIIYFPAYLNISCNWHHYTWMSLFGMKMCMVSVSMSLGKCFRKMLLKMILWATYKQPAW